MPTSSSRVLLVGLCCLTASRVSAQQYSVSGFSLGGDASFAAAVNSAGHAVGGAAVTGTAPLHPFLWANGSIRDLGLLPGFPHCEATAINDVEQVIGNCYDAATNTSQAFTWTAASGLTALSVPANYFASGLNDSGVIVGSTTGAQGIHAWVLRAGVLSDLGPGIARDVNNRGQIAGAAFNLDRAALWDADGVHDLGTLPDGRTSFGIAISPGGYVVGTAAAGGAETPAAVFTPYGVGNLGTLGGPGAQAAAIDSGIVVGEAMGPDNVFRAFFYDLNGPGVMIDLNTRIDSNAGWNLAQARGVNSAGMIVGNGKFNGFDRGFVLTPGGPPTTAGNLLVNAGFEDSRPPQLEPPGWVADDFRQVAANSETNQPRSGDKNGACWTTDNLDCGMFQDLRAPKTGTYTLTIYANADRPGALVGANVNDDTAATADVAVRGFANYGDAYVLTFQATEGQTIRVWMYSPAVPGYLVVDDAVLTGPTS